MGQFDKETTNKNFEWHRERILREKKSPNPYTENRLNFNLKAIEKKHGQQAAKEAAKEFESKSKRGNKKFYT